LNLYWINAQGATNGQSYPQETYGAQAAIDYVNKKLGGVDGHPLHLATCATDGSPAATTTCANKAVAAKPIAVTLGTVPDDNDVIAVTAKSGIPFVSNGGYTAQTLTAKGKSFILNNYAEAIVLALPLVMKRNGIKNVAEVYVNVPGVVGGLLPVAEQAMDNLGISHKRYPVPYPSPDLTSTISAVAGTNADAVMFQADPTTCGAGLSAIKALNFSKPIYTGAACMTPANNKLVAKLPQKIYGQYKALPADTNDPDSKVFTAAMTDAGRKNLLADGFTNIMNIYNAMKKASAAGGDVTSASLVKALEAGGIHSFMMGASAMLNCDGTLLPSLPALCAADALVGEWKGDKLTNVETIHGQEALKK
jgi:branched-chain amino acid transport system substrate-binding protein